MIKSVALIGVPGERDVFHIIASLYFAQKWPVPLYSPQTTNILTLKSLDEASLDPMLE